MEDEKKARQRENYKRLYGDTDPEPERPNGTICEQIAFIILSAGEKGLYLQEIFKRGAESFPYWNWVTGEHKHPWQKSSYRTLYYGAWSDLSTKKINHEWSPAGKAAWDDQDKKETVFCQDDDGKWHVNHKINRDKIRKSDDDFTRTEDDILMHATFEYDLMARYFSRNDSDENEAEEDLTKRERLYVLDPEKNQWYKKWFDEQNFGNAPESHPPLLVQEGKRGMNGASSAGMVSCTGPMKS